MEENTYEVTMKHVTETGAVLWEYTFEAADQASAHTELELEGDKVLVKWATGAVLIFLRPGERVEVIGKDVDK